MAYIGNQAQSSFTSFDKQTITGDGTTGPYTLSHAVSNEQEIEVFVNNVRQEPSVAYTTSGDQITMTGNVLSTDDFYVVFQGKAVQTVVPPAGSVTDSMIVGMASSKLSGALPAIDGSALTGVGTSVAVIADQKAYNVGGGNSVAGFNDRDLNTEIFDPDGIVSISSNQFTLNAGTYIIEFSSVAYDTNRNFTELYDVTNSATVGQGMTRYSVATYNGETTSEGYAQVTPSVSTTYKIRTYTQAAATSGLGVSHDVSGNDNIYTLVKITKLA